MKILTLNRGGVAILTLSGLLITLFGWLSYRTHIPPEASVVHMGSFVDQPYSLEEAFKLSDLVVVGQVRDVVAGENLVLQATSTDHPTMEFTTTLVKLGIANGLKGRESIGSEITIYRPNYDGDANGSPEIYAIGETFLVFLKLRDDGTYYVIAPEGNYRITSDGRLHWAWITLLSDDERAASFASKLDGQDLNDVLVQLSAIEP